MNMIVIPYQLVCMFGYPFVLDIIFIANEVVDVAKKLKNELLLFKVDFEKTFDLVDWKYLELVMVK